MPTELCEMCCVNKVAPGFMRCGRCIMKDAEIEARYIQESAATPQERDDAE